MIVTAHAAERYIERVAPAMTMDEARAAIGRSERAIETAAGFGCDTVRLGCGAKLVLTGDVVKTVLPAPERKPRGARR